MIKKRGVFVACGVFIGIQSLVAMMDSSDRYIDENQEEVSSDEGGDCSLSPRVLMRSDETRDLLKISTSISRESSRTISSSDESAVYDSSLNNLAVGCSVPCEREKSLPSPSYMEPLTQEQRRLVAKQLPPCATSMGKTNNVMLQDTVEEDTEINQPHEDSWWEPCCRACAQHETVVTFCGVTSFFGLLAWLKMTMDNK